MEFIPSFFELSNRPSHLWIWKKQQQQKNQQQEQKKKTTKKQKKKTLPSLNFEYLHFFL